jgi:hypothetical protein
MNFGSVMNRGRAVAVMIAWASCFDVSAQTDKGCAVEHVQAENGATIVVEMTLVNDGTPCNMRRSFGGAPATSLIVRGRPVNGTLSSTRSDVSYTPNPGFEGKDAFDVQWFGSGFGPNSPSHNVRTKVEVTVRAKGDEPEAKSTKPAM